MIIIFPWSHPFTMGSSQLTRLRRSDSPTKLEKLGKLVRSGLAMVFLGATYWWLLKNCNRYMLNYLGLCLIILLLKCPWPSYRYTCIYIYIYMFYRGKTKRNKFPHSTRGELSQIQGLWWWWFSSVMIVILYKEVSRLICHVK